MSLTEGSADVFISYAANDRPRVLEIVEQLQLAGVSVWLDRQQLQGGSVWAEELVRGINACKIVVLMVSDASMASWPVMQEIQIAGTRRKVLLPVLLSQTSYPEQAEFFLAGREWIEVLDRPSSEWLPRLLRVLTRVSVASRNQQTPGARSDRDVPDRPEENTADAARVRTFEELKRQSRLTNLLRPLNVPARPAGKTRDLGAGQHRVRHGFPIGSEMRLLLESERQGHLLLLDQGPSGKLYCLCPSDFAPSTSVLPGPNYYPQEGSGYDSFVLTGVPGREELLAIISDCPLALDWKPHENTPARILSEADIQSLVSILEHLPDRSWVALSTYFDVLGC